MCEVAQLWTVHSVTPTVGVDGGRSSSCPADPAPSSPCWSRDGPRGAMSWIRRGSGRPKMSPRREVPFRPRRPGELPLIEGTLIRPEADHLPGDHDPLPVRPGCADARQRGMSHLRRADRDRAHPVAGLESAARLADAVGDKNVVHTHLGPPSPWCPASGLGSVATPQSGRCWGFSPSRE